MDSPFQYLKVAKGGSSRTFLVLAAVLVIRCIRARGVPLLSLWERSGSPALPLILQPEEERPERRITTWRSFIHPRLSNMFKLSHTLRVSPRAFS